MSSPTYLIAEREFRTYVATASFWVALAIGPLTMAGAVMLASGMQTPVRVALHADEPALEKSAASALLEAGSAEGRHYLIAESEPAANLSLVREADGVVEARFGDGFPLSPSGRALVARTIERDEAFAGLAKDGLHPRTRVVDALGEKASGSDPAKYSRFALVMMLWLTLTGSLGMLLQAIVRERVNKSLESLLVAVFPWQIVVGKLVGVGAVSAILLVVWLGSAAGLTALGSAGGGAKSIFASIAAPAMLARAGLVYLLAYAFYGFVTIAIGARARDVATAQNLSRPMFALLLLVFLVSLATISGTGKGLAWLVYIPPFTPFVLLMRSPSELSMMSQIGAVALMVLAISAASRLAVARLTFQGSGLS